MGKTGTLFMLPNTLGGDLIHQVIPPYLQDLIQTIDHYAVENEKVGRRYLKKLGIKKAIDDLSFFPIHRNADDNDEAAALNVLRSGHHLGVISDAGSPGIADPGSSLVRAAHQQGIKVKPITGPSSVTLALMASGFNGQQFVFHGYLPKDRKERKRALRSIEKSVFDHNQTQIFIETPYRNLHLFEDILLECQPDTLLCMACNLTLEDEMIKVRTVGEWKSLKPDIHKKPCIFLLYR